MGMFSAVSNLGAGGTQDVSLSDISNGVLYGMFAVTGLVAGGFNNSKSLSLRMAANAAQACTWFHY